MNFSQVRSQLYQFNLRRCRDSLVTKSAFNSRIYIRYSSNITNDEIIVDSDSYPGIAIMKFNRKPVNSLNHGFLQKSLTTLKHIEENKSCGALILTSNIPKIFCAGLEFTEVYGTTPEKFVKFYSALQEFWCALFATRLATVAAINGSSPAGGCVFALACDYRIMNKENPKCTIGLNEVKLGLALRSWISQIFCETVGNQKGHLAMSLGKLFTAEQAYNIGLIDEVANNQEDLMQKAVSQATEFLNIPWIARHESKMEWRQPYLDKMKQDRERSMSQMASFILRQDTQANLKSYMENLQSRRK